MDIWKDVFLKNIYCKNIKKATTLSNTDQDKQIQIFEFLVAETLAKIYPDLEWKVSQVQGDQGVDILGKISCPLSPILLEKSSLLVLGQIKRRKGNYRFDDYKNDITKLYEYYTSNALFKNHSLMKLIFVISTDKETQLDNLKRNMSDVINNKKPSIFYSTIHSPIEMINASNIIKYWKLDMDFVFDRLEGVLTEKQSEKLKDFLSEPNDSFVQISYTDNEQQFIFNTVTKKIYIENQLSGVPLDVYIKWCPDEDAKGVIQLISPLPLIHDSGMKISIRDNLIINMNFRGTKEGTYSLGKIYIYSSSGTFNQIFDLGMIYFEESFYYRYNSLPYTDMEKILKNNIKDISEQATVNLICGHGGIGKSSFLEQLKIYAENNNYVSICLSYPKDNINGRNFIINFVGELLREATLVTKANLTDGIKKFLNIYYQNSWNEDLEKLFYSNDPVSINSIAECLYMIIWYHCLKHPLFIQLSDMHWINKENKEIFNELISQIAVGKKYFINPFRLFLEGRDKEFIQIEGQKSFPHNWHVLISNDYIVKYTLKPWALKDTRDYIYSLFGDNITLNSLFQKSCERLIQYVHGYPMLILEQIKYLVDIGKIRVDKGKYLTVIDYNWTECFTDKIDSAIELRIAYYREKYTSLLDCLIIWAKISEFSSESVWQFLLRKLRQQFDDIDRVLQQSHFLGKEIGKTVFSHEYYKENLKRAECSSNEYIQLAIQYLQKRDYNDIYVQYSLILLYQMDIETDASFLTEQIVTLLKKSEDDFINYNLYKMLLNLSDNYSSNHLPKYIICYNLGEIIIRIGNWFEGVEYFKECLKQIDFNDDTSLLYYMRSCQELGNILCDLLIFTDALQYCEKGINLFRSIEKSLPEQSKTLFEQEYDKLTERLAVCYWFAGNLQKARKLQQKAYKNSCQRNDNYMKLRCLYEIGTLNLHYNVDTSIRQIEDALQMKEYIPAEYKQEETLIHVQLLMGKTVKAINGADDNEIQQILNTTQLLCAKMKKSIFCYESSLNYLIQGTCFAYLEQYEEALNSFVEAIKQAEFSASKNLLWKGYINAAQICYLINNRIQCQYYAQKCMDIFVEYWKYNPTPVPSFEILVSDVIYKSKKLLHIQDNQLYTVHESDCPACKMIAVNIKNVTLYLMN